MSESIAHKRYMKRYHTEQERESRRETVQARISRLTGLVGPDKPLDIGRVRHAAMFMRYRSDHITSPSKMSMRDALEVTSLLSEMSMCEALQAIDFATGYLPWPASWTKRNYELAVEGWTMEV